MDGVVEGDKQIPLPGLLAGEDGRQVVGGIVEQVELVHHQVGVQGQGGLIASGQVAQAQGVSRLPDQQRLVEGVVDHLRVGMAQVIVGELLGHRPGAPVPGAGEELQGGRDAPRGRQEAGVGDGGDAIAVADRQINQAGDAVHGHRSSLIEWSPD